MASSREDTRKQLEAVVADAPDGMRLVEFAVQNVMKIKFAHIKPKGNVIVVGGRNGQGKSSLLQAIGFLLCGGELMPSDVIRTGQKTATIVGQIGPFKVTRYFNRKESDEGRNSNRYMTKIKVEGPHGEEYPRRQELLEMLLEQLSFDPLAFLRMDTKQQFATLKSMGTFEIDVDALDAEQAIDYEVRREARYHAEAITARLKATLTVVCPACKGTGETVKVIEAGTIVKAAKTSTTECEQCKGLGAIPPELPAATGDPKALAEQLQTAAGHNAGVERAIAEKKRLEALAADVASKASELRNQARALLERATALDGFTVGITMTKKQSVDCQCSRILEEASSVVIGEMVDTAEVSKQLGEAMAAAKAVEQRKAIEALQVEHVAGWAAWTEVNDRMKVRKDERAAAMQAAKMPIEGLALGLEEVYYKEMPFNQASGAEQIRVSLAIGMAANPKLRVLRFMDGGWDMLDEDSQALVRAELEKNNFQLWAEHVGTKGAMSVVMEDGTASGEDAIAE